MRTEGDAWGVDCAIYSAMAEIVSGESGVGSWSRWVFLGQAFFVGFGVEWRLRRLVVARGRCGSSIGSEVWGVKDEGVEVGVFGSSIAKGLVTGITGEEKGRREVAGYDVVDLFVVVEVVVASGRIRVERGV